MKTKCISKQLNLVHFTSLSENANHIPIDRESVSWNSNFITEQEVALLEYDLSCSDEDIYLSFPSDIILIDDDDEVAPHVAVRPGMKNKQLSKDDNTLVGLLDIDNDIVELFID